MTTVSSCCCVRGLRLSYIAQDAYGAMVDATRYSTGIVQLLGLKEEVWYLQRLVVISADSGAGGAFFRRTRRTCLQARFQGLAL